MNLPADRNDTPRLRLAIVLDTTEDVCTVFGDGRRLVVPYAAPFPRPRVERVRPGHLVAVAGDGDGPGVVLWRWFDAVVVESSAESVTVWEPAHGTVFASRRNSERRYLPVVVPTSPPGSPARRGGWPDRPSKPPRTPTSISSRSRISSPLSVGGTTPRRPGLADRDIRA